MGIDKVRELYGKHIIVIAILLFGIITIWQSSLIDWDEGVFALQGQWIASFGSEGKPYNFQTPPLFQLIVAAGFTLTDSSWYTLPLISLFFSCLTLYIVYSLTSSLFSKQEAFFAVVFCATTELFLFFTRSGLSDATFLFFFIAATHFFIKGLARERIREFIFTAIFATLALYTKYSAAPLLIAFAIIGLCKRRGFFKPWFLLSIILPCILFIPFVIVFIFAVQPAIISTRHGPLLGIYHLHYLHYLLIFAPVACVLGLLYVIVRGKPHAEISLYIISGTYFLCVGFYHPYMRLILPLIPFLSILTARLFADIKRLKPLLLCGIFFCNLVLGYHTITYCSNIPRTIASRATTVCERYECKYLYTMVPPNISFYVPGEILVPENHAWASLGKKIPVFMKHKSIIERSHNELQERESVIYLYSNLHYSLKQNYRSVFQHATLEWTGEFIDAPLYYKDPYNPLRDMTQTYEIHILPLQFVSPHVIDDCWYMGFERGVTVFRQK